MTHSSSIFICGGAFTNTLVGSSGGFGVRNWPEYMLDIVPLTKNASNLSASQSPGSAALVLAAGTGVTAVVDGQGVTRYTFDVERTVTVTSGGNDSGINFLIKGYDMYGAAMSQALTGANATVATTTKAFLSVISIVPSGAVATTTTAGSGDSFGLPVQLTDKGYTTCLNWNNTVAIDAGTLTVADATTPATTTTGDVRGTYLPSSASNGVKRLVLRQAMNAAQVSNSNAAANVIAILGVTQV